MADEFDIKQMEKQYIDKRSAMELAYRFATSCVSRFVVDREIETLEKLIQQIPSADVVEVRHGEWKWRNGGECSECGFHNSNFNFNFCPNCGARMDGGT